MNKIKDAINYIAKNENKKLKIIVAIGMIGILLISMSDFIVPKDKNQTTNQNDKDYYSYVDNLESKLTNIISSIDGVGECRVMITLENTNESVYATDNESKTDDDSLNTKDKYVIYDSENGETPVLIKEYMPTVQGVTVVCSGGDNVEVKEKIINTVTSLFNISTNRVSVSKIKN